MLQKTSSNESNTKAFILLVLLGLLLALPTFHFISKKSKRDSRKKHKMSSESFVSLQDLHKHKILREHFGTIPQTSLIQPYFFLGKGKQAFAFVSSDGKYVLKLVKQPKKAKASKKIKNLVRSYSTAAQFIPHETGILYLHSGRDVGISTQKLTLLTKKGDALQLDIHKYFFAIQERAIPFKEKLIRLMASDPKQARTCLVSIFTLLKSISERSVEDLDGALIRNQNIGFIGLKPILLDTGKLQYIPSKDLATLKSKNLKHLKPLKRWIELSIPELSETYQEQVNSF